MAKKAKKKSSTRARAKTKLKKTKAKSRSKTSALKTRTRSTARRVAKSAKKGASGMTDAAIAAAVELGHAAENFRESLRHITAARNKGGRVIRPIRTAGKKAARFTRRTIARVTG